MTYKQASKTPKDGWINAGRESMLAAGSQILGNKYCINPNVIYDACQKKKITTGIRLIKEYDNTDKILNLVL